MEAQYTANSDEALVPAVMREGHMSGFAGCESGKAYGILNCDSNGHDQVIYPPYTEGERAE